MSYKNKTNTPKSQTLLFRGYAIFSREDRDFAVYAVCQDTGTRYFLGVAKTTSEAQERINHWQHSAARLEAAFLCARWGS